MIRSALMKLSPTSNLATLILPWYFAATLSIVGAYFLQGPHQSAMKSTSTGILLFTTSDSQLASESCTTCELPPEFCGGGDVSHPTTMAITPAARRAPSRDLIFGFMLAEGRDWNFIKEPGKQRKSERAFSCLPGFLKDEIVISLSARHRWPSRARLRIRRRPRSSAAFRPL